MADRDTCSMEHVKPEPVEPVPDMMRHPLHPGVFTPSNYAYPRAFPQQCEPAQNERALRLPSIATMTANMVRQGSLEDLELRLDEAEADLRLSFHSRVEAEREHRRQLQDTDRKLSALKSRIRVLETDSSEVQRWMLEADRRLQHQVDLMAEIVKNCIQGDAAEVLRRREMELLQQSPGQAPPSPQPVEESVPQQQRIDDIEDDRNPSMTANEASEEGRAVSQMLSSNPLSPLPMQLKVEQGPPQVRIYPTRSTGKRVQGAKRAGGSKRPYKQKRGKTAAESRTQPYPTPSFTSSATGSPQPSGSKSCDVPSSLPSVEVVSQELRNCTKHSSLEVTQPDGSRVPIYYFQKHPETIKEQWAEYAYGTHRQLSVRELDETHGTKWRSNQYARTWYSRRKRLWDLVISFMKNGLSEEEALAKVEERKGAGTVAGLVDRLAHESRQSNKRLAGSLTASSSEAPSRTPGLEKRRIMAADAGNQDQETDGLPTDSEEERPRKRRSSLQLRTRIVGPSYSDADKEQDGASSAEESQGSDAEWE